MFKTSVFPVPAGAKRTVTMRYSQLLRKDHNLTDFLFPLGTAKYTSKPVEKVSINATIESNEEIKSVYSPTHLINIKRPDDKHAVVAYEKTNEVPSSDFRLFYDIAKGKLGASVLSYRPDQGEDGFLLLLASPQIKAKQDAATADAERKMAKARKNRRRQAKLAEASDKKRQRLADGSGLEGEAEQSLVVDSSAEEDDSSAE